MSQGPVAHEHLEHYLSRLATGIQLADENLAVRPARVRKRREHAPPGRGARPLRPRRPVSLLDGPALSQAPGLRDTPRDRWHNGTQES